MDSHLKQFFNFAIAREWIEVHPLAGLTKEKIGGRQKERDRYLSEEEIIELSKQLPDANLLRTTELAIWIMLSTCCRVGELSKARWENVDLEVGEWFIPAGNSKNAKNHIIYLSDFAKEQFIALYAITADTGWCFPSRDGETHICLKSRSVSTGVIIGRFWPVFKAAGGRADSQQPALALIVTNQSDSTLPSNPSSRSTAFISSTCCGEMPPFWETSTPTRMVNPPELTNLARTLL